MKREEKKIIIEVIETPRGPVPTAESIKTLVEAWNEILTLINNNTSELCEKMKKVEKNLLNFSLSISSLSGKINALISVLNDLKMSINELRDYVKRIAERESNNKQDEVKELAKKRLEELLE
ncbi:MAG: hypothetical protein ACTSVA_03420 [Candidatus Njordarchaeales archaeon]